MSEQTEIEQALEIARKTRNEILFGKNTLEKNIHGFYTVAQILDRIDDIVWAKSELEGYSCVYPKYRLNTQRSFEFQGIQIKEVIGDDISKTDCSLTIQEIEKILDPKSKFYSNFIINDIEFEKIKEYSSEHTGIGEYFFEKKNIG